MSALKDRLPREALIALPQDQLADTLLEAWADVDHQQYLLDRIGQDSGHTGVGVFFDHKENGVIYASACGPYSEISRLVPRLFDILKRYFKMVGLVVKEGSQSTRDGLPGKQKPQAEEGDDDANT